MQVFPQLTFLGWAILSPCFLAPGAFGIFLL